MPTMVQMKFGVMARVLIGNHLKLCPSRLQRDEKKHPLGIERGVHVSTITGGGHEIEHSERGVIEITLGAHLQQFIIYKAPYFPRKPSTNSSNIAAAMFSQRDAPVNTT